MTDKNSYAVLDEHMNKQQKAVLEQHEQTTKDLINKAKDGIEKLESEDADQMINNLD